MPSFRLRKSTGSADFYQIQGAKKMKEYTYYFADGTKNTIEVEEKWYDLLKEMDEAERKQKYNYERHNYPLSQVDYEGETFADYSADPFEKMVAEIDKERIAAALTTLTNCQRVLFEKVFVERKKITEIAKEEGVSQQSVHIVLKQSLSKLKEILKSLHF